MGKKMKKYYKDYVSEPKPDKNGKVKKSVTYVGDYYEYQLTQENYQKFRNIVLATAVIHSILYLIAGLLNNDGSRCFYVLISYVGMLLPTIYFWTAVFGMKRLPEKMEFVTYDKTICRLKRTSTAILVMAVLTILGDGIFIVQKAGSIQIEKELFFLILNIVIGVFISVYINYQSRICCDKV